MATVIEGTFDAADEVSSTIQVSGSADISLSFGTASATVALERYISGEWRQVEDWTADYENRLNGTAKPRPYRLKCTAYTSGEVKYFLG